VGGGPPPPPNIIFWGLFFWFMVFGASCFGFWFSGLVFLIYGFWGLFFWFMVFEAYCFGLWFWGFFGGRGVQGARSPLPTSFFEICFFDLWFSRIVFLIVSLCELTIYKKNHNETASYFLKKTAKRTKRTEIGRER
jgi:hypothetical protein